MEYLRLDENTFLKHNGLHADSLSSLKNKLKTNEHQRHNLQVFCGTKVAENVKKRWYFSEKEGEDNQISSKKRKQNKIISIESINKLLEKIRRRYLECKRKCYGNWTFQQ